MTYIPVFENKFTLDNINMMVTSSQVIWTNPGSANFNVSGGAISCTFANSITTGPTIGIGTSAVTNDILVPVAILALNAAGKSFSFQMIGMSAIVPPAASIYLNITQAAAGLSQLVSANITGYFS